MARAPSHIKLLLKFALDASELGLAGWLSKFVFSKIMSARIYIKTISREANAKHFSGSGQDWYRNTIPLFSDIRRSPLRIFIGLPDDDLGNATSMSFWSYVTYLVTPTSLSSLWRYVYRIAKIATTATNPSRGIHNRPTGTR